MTARKNIVSAGAVAAGLSNVAHAAGTDTIRIGLVGAGGIGRTLKLQYGYLRFDRLLAVVIVLFCVVILIEMVSVYVRRRLV